MKVTFKNPRTGDLKQVKIGWSWTLLFFASFFGLPLFLRRLYGWGTAMFALQAVVFFVSLSIDPYSYDQTPQMILLLCWIVSFVSAIYLAVKGNELTARNYLEHGWVFSEPESDVVRMAKGRWGLL